jgi:hypothetical protein
MATATLPTTDTDIAHAVTAAFDELDCDSAQKDKIPCGGPIMGFREHHDCRQGWLCENHWKHCIDVILPHYRQAFQSKGCIGCAYCARRFDDLRKFVRLYPKDPK